MPQMLKCVTSQVGSRGRLGRVRRSCRGPLHGVGLVGKALNQDMDV